MRVSVAAANILLVAIAWVSLAHSAPPDLKDIKWEDSRDGQQEREDRVNALLAPGLQAQYDEIISVTDKVARGPLSSPGLLAQLDRFYAAKRMALAVKNQRLDRDMLQRMSRTAETDSFASQFADFLTVGYVYGFFPVEQSKYQEDEDDPHRQHGHPNHTQCVALRERELVDCLREALLSSAICTMKRIESGTLSEKERVRLEKEYANATPLMKQGHLDRSKRAHLGVVSEKTCETSG